MIENKGNSTIGAVEYDGVINGWSLGSTFGMTGANNIQPGTKTKCNIWFTTEDTDVASYEELENMNLTFTVKDESYAEMFKAETGMVHFGESAETAGAVSNNEESGAGKEKVIIDRDDIRIYLTGEHSALDNCNGISGNFMFQVECIIENKGNNAIGAVEYDGVINGWSLGSTYGMNGANNIQPGTKAKSNIWFTTEDTEVISYDELESMSLTFTGRLSITTGS